MFLAARPLPWSRSGPGSLPPASSSQLSPWGHPSFRPAAGDRPARPPKISAPPSDRSAPLPPAQRRPQLRRASRPTPSARRSSTRTPLPASPPPTRRRSPPPSASRPPRSPPFPRRPPSPPIPRRRRPCPPARRRCSCGRRPTTSAWPPRSWPRTTRSRRSVLRCPRPLRPSLRAVGAAAVRRGAEAPRRAADCGGGDGREGPVLQPVEQEAGGEESDQPVRALCLSALPACAHRRRLRH